MADNTNQRAQTPWLAMRLAVGISQREAERRLGWGTHGRLSLIERGIAPDAAQAQQLRQLYGALLAAPLEPQVRQEAS